MQGVSDCCYRNVIHHHHHHHHHRQHYTRILAYAWSVVTVPPPHLRANPLWVGAPHPRYFVLPCPCWGMIGGSRAYEETGTKHMFLSNMNLRD